MNTDDSITSTSSDIVKPIGFAVPITDLDSDPPNPEFDGSQLQATSMSAPVPNNPEKMSQDLVVPSPNSMALDDDPNSGFDMNQGVHFRKQKKPPAMNRHISFQPSVGGQSVRSNHSSHSEHDAHHAPPPSTAIEKWKHTRRFFATVFALCYCIFLIVFGAVIYIGDAVDSQYPLPEAYSITILGIAFIYFIFLYIDIRVHVWKAKKALKDREKRQELYEEQLQKVSAIYQTNSGAMELSPNGMAPGNFQTAIQLPEWNIPEVKPVSHKYCFATGRHGEFFYLKIGATWFCFGLLIHSILIITYQIIYLTSDDPLQHECASVLRLVFDFLFPIYSIFLLFFFFKYANVIINERRGLARIMLMHSIGTSLAFWIFTIVRETSDAIRLKQYGYDDVEAFWIASSKPLKIDCSDPTRMNSIYRNFAPYLYPFVIEFCILIVGMFYMIFSNINKCPKRVSAPGHDHSHDIYDTAETIPGSGLVHDHDHVTEHPLEENTHHGQHHQGPTMYTPGENAPLSEHSDHCRTTVDHDNEYKSNLIIHADCHRANRGLFAGLILVVCTIAFIILFFVATGDEEYFYIGWLTNTIFELVVLAIMIVAVLMAYWQISHLDVNTHPMSKLDDVLLLIAIPAFFLETIFSMVPAIYYGTGLNIAIVMCQLVQIMIQTPFIIDGLRRCANTKQLRKKKPGREMVTFLTIANVSLWLFYTFSVKTRDTGDERYKYYGDVLWSILNHLSLPLIMFYRFHASVCLVDIWRHSYEPGGH